MPTPPMLEASPSSEWSSEDFVGELERLALLEDLAPVAGTSLSDLPGLLFDDELARVAEELEQIAALEGR